MDDYKNIPCPQCSQPLKLLFSSFYCSKCGIDGNSIESRKIGFTVVDKVWWELSDNKIVPPGTLMHIYRTYQEAQRILGAVTFPALVAETDLSEEGEIVWSTPYSHHVYTNKNGIRLKPGN